MSKTLTSFRWILIFCIFLLSAGCSTSGIIRFKLDFDPEEHSEVDDIEKFFVLHKGRWWNYYERGLAFMAGGHWDKAIEDFKVAFDQMPYDERGARTYGLNRIDYYASREAGIASYKKITEDIDIKNDIKEYVHAIDKACDLLKDSLESVVSSRAQYYLREVFKNHPNREEIEAPIIKPEHPGTRVVENRIVELTILIKDENFIDSIWVDDKQLFFELGAQRIEFEIDQKLDYGDNYIEIRATNLAGKEDSKRIHLIRTKPSKQNSFQNKFITRPTARKSNVLVETVAYSAISKNTASLMRFAAKGGYNLLNLSQASDTSNTRNEQQSDPTTDDYLPDELLPPRERYRILTIPFKHKGRVQKLPTGKILNEVLYKELGKALDFNKRFRYLKLDDDELREIWKLDNKDRFKLKAVRKFVNKYLQGLVDGILIGTIKQIEKDMPEVEVYLHDLEDGRDEILRAEYHGKIKSDKDVDEFAAKVVQAIVSLFPLKKGKVTEVRGNEFDCYFKKYQPRKNMKLMIFKPNLTRLKTEGKIYLPAPKVQAVLTMPIEGEEVQEGYTVVTK